MKSHLYHPHYLLFNAMEEKIAQYFYSFNSVLTVFIDGNFPCLKLESILY